MVMLLKIVSEPFKFNIQPRVASRVGAVIWKWQMQSDGTYVRSNAAEFKRDLALQSFGY